MTSTWSVKGVIAGDGAGGTATGGTTSNASGQSGSNGNGGNGASGAAGVSIKALGMWMELILVVVAVAAIRQAHWQVALVRAVKSHLLIREAMDGPTITTFIAFSTSCFIAK